MKATVLGPVAALVIGGAAGFLAGKNTAPGMDADKDIPADARSAARRAASASSGGAASRGDRVKSVKDALATRGQSARTQALLDFYASLDPSQFADEAKKLEDLPWSERIMAGYLLFARWGEEDPTAAMAYTKTMGMAGNFVRGTVMQSWAAKYPEDAAKYYTDNPAEFRMAGMMRGGGGRGGSTAGVIAAEWARQDSDSAMAWATSLDGRDQRDAVRSIVSEAAKEDPAEAAAMLSSIDDADAKKDAQNTIAREWGKSNWGEAQAWIATLPADQQSDALSRALRGLAEADPEAAAANITAIPEGEDRDAAVEDIAREWGRQDPSAAASWLLANGSADAQEDGIGRVVSSWVTQDSEAAYAFVNEQPAGEVRDEAVSSYVRANMGGDVQQNLQLAESITNDRDRARTVGMTAMMWARSDKEAATEYIENTSALSDEARARVLQMSQGGGRGGRGGGGRGR
ncbi:hypothetical protein JO972_04160 [Verrucomicrobiaceae bacterium 5K15]|uniref:Uncharacterized protein n=1 Tax=Oceaniferula flava TaxID=2800421 RepID=A0AAE2S9Y5_9BACT|nr:hypothetical protein [Oceaniferula flavus]MBK1854135.1 hypothetical protein [Oceaniferula flavus]MBM1135441.1 hypothetical protein [Oceaniferula flavus]